MVRFYERTLDIALRFRFITLMVFLATVSAQRAAVRGDPQGLLPRPGYRHPDRHDRRRAGHLVRRDGDVAAAGEQIVLADPAVASVVASVGAGVAGQTANNGRMYITLKPWDQRKDNAFQVIQRIDQKMQAVQGIRLFLQAVQDVRVGGRISRTQYQYTLQDDKADELNTWAPKILDKLRTPAAARRRHVGPGGCRHHRDVDL